MPDVVADTDSGPRLEIYAEVRHACAANCASMAAFIGAEEFARKVATLRQLAADPHFVVRRAIAANLLELCRQLDHQAKVIHPVWNQLVVDPFNDVISALVPQVGAIIELMTRLGPHSPFAEVLEEPFDDFPATTGTYFEGIKIKRRYEKRRNRLNLRCSAFITKSNVDEKR